MTNDTSMKKQESDSSQFGKFDAVVNKLLSVSHKELQAREKKYQARRKQKSGRSLKPAFPDPVSSKLLPKLGAKPGNPYADTPQIFGADEIQSLAIGVAEGEIGKANAFRSGNLAQAFSRGR
jgi:hypothetical protein